jgi:hypothetical protein
MSTNDVPESNLVKHARRELKFIGMDPENTNPEDGYNTMAAKAIIELVQVFAAQGHSGFSGSYVLNAFKKVADFEPLGPITGDDSEWMEVGSGVFQNIRCSHVFKSADRFDGQAYDIQGRVFREPSGSSFTGRESCVPITFPYTPVTEYVDVPASGD